MKNVLFKGSKFIPTFFPSLADIYFEIKAFIRKLLLKVYFKGEDELVSGNVDSNVCCTTIDLDDSQLNLSLYDYDGSDLYELYENDEQVNHDSNYNTGYGERNNVIMYKRFIDDLIFICKGDIIEFFEFVEVLNNNGHNLSFSYELNRTQINFLDLSLFENGENIGFRPFRKSTSVNMFLHATSMHPDHLLKALPYGEFKRIIDHTSNVNEKANELNKVVLRLSERGYNKTQLFICRDKLLGKKADVVNFESRHEDFTMEHNKDGEKLFYVTKFTAFSEKLVSLVRKYWGLRKWHFVLVMVYFHGCGSAPRRKQRDSGTHIFYAVQLDGDSNDAKSLAERHGLKFISKIGNLEGHYTFKDHKGVMSKKDMVERLSKEHLVKWVEHQRAHYRDKRAVFSMSGDRTGHEFIQAEREIPIAVYSIMNSDEGLKDPVVFNDPYWPMQWELYNHGQYGGPKRFDLNIMPVWKRGISGRGVVVTIIDDGVDPTNRDLRSNFDLYASFDLRDAHGLSHDPTPPSDLRSGHGTRCAGEIAMVANNSFCGVGIAFNSRIGGIRLLDGPVTDAMEATSLTYNNDYIDIYSCCWGPKDNGKKMGGPGILTKKALRLGAEKGRNGKGSIFVWASGNGGMVNDHCGADGYVNSIYTIAIGAITHYGFPAFFGEPCPAVMAVTLTGAPYSLFGGRLPLVTSSNTDDGCVTHFTGTSSAAPMAAGVLALVLEAK
ncbi:PC3-like endoprotease variant B [Protopterus annectens]|uniref:PC3-like endoprotease variant B n=1 Tax=Protopterus annectens TaxID=7888 RepID=UPI001CFBBAB6|nr:PC3-like endoprotease variant B [Protopterus annectens]